MTGYLVYLPKRAQLRSTLFDPWTVVHQIPLSMVISKQEYWSRLPFPPLYIIRTTADRLSLEGLLPFLTSPSQTSQSHDRPGKNEQFHKAEDTGDT